MALAIVTLPAAVFGQPAPSKQQAVEAHLKTALGALQSGDSARAESEFRAIVALDPSNTDARANLGALGFFRGDWAGAAAQFRQVLKAQPRLWKAQAFLGMCERRLGHGSEARRFLEQSVPQLEHGALRTQAGLELLDILYQAQDLPKAIEVVGLLGRANPTDPDVLYAAYRIYADLANQARDALALAAPDSARTRQAMAQHLINHGDLAGALVQYRKALEIDPKLRGVHYELGEAILLNSVSEEALREAEKEFQQALQEDPADANAECKLGRVYATRLDFKTAIGHFSRALDLRPDHVEAHLGLAEALLRIDEPRRAIEHLLAASRLDPLNVTAHYRLAAIYREMGREADARSELAAFKKLQEAKQKIRAVYQEMRLAVPKRYDMPEDPAK